VNLTRIYTRIGYLGIVALIAFSVLSVYGISGSSYVISSAGTIIAGNNDPVKLMTAYYYIWYSGSIVITDDTPKLGWYSSDNTSVIDQHIDWAKANGIDFFTVSWEATTWFNINLEKVAQRAAAKNFKLAIIGEWSGYDMARIQTDMEYFFKNFGAREVFKVIKNKPLIACYGSWKHTVAEWTELLNTIRGEGYDAIFLYEPNGANEGEDTKAVVSSYLDVFDGIYTYGRGATNYTYESQWWINRLKTLSQVVESYPQPRIWMPHISPGWGASGQPYEGRTEDYYNQCFNNALSTNPSILAVNSWNEIYEHSYIEPSVNYGYVFLNMTNMFKSNFISAQS